MGLFVLRARRVLAVLFPTMTEGVWRVCSLPPMDAGKD